MNLRQIVREQKLQRFDYKLGGFISEADDEEVEKKDAFAGKTKAGSSKYWYVNNQGQMKAVVNPPSEGGWELADKDQAKEAEEREKSVEVDIDDEAREIINQEMESQNLKPHPEDENVFVDEDGDEIFQIDPDGEVIPGGDIDKFKSAEGEPYADYIDDINDKLYGGDEKKGGEEEAPPQKPTPKKKEKKGYDWRDETHEPEGEGGRPSTSQINDLRTQMFDGKVGRSSDWAGKANSTPNSDPPSDAIARQTALDTGFPKKGTKPWPTSNVTGQPAAPAPGNAGSMMNEIFSVEGCNVAEAFYERFGAPPTVEEMEAILDEQFSNSQLAAENDGPNGSKYKEKLRIAAEASLTKFDRLQNGLDKTANSDPPFGVDEEGNSTVIRPPSEYYGAAESIEAQVNMVRGVEYPAKIYGPNGPIESINKTPQAEEELTTAIIALSKNSDDPEWAKLNKGTAKSPKPDMDKIRDYVDQLLDNPISDEDNHQKIKKFAEVLAASSGGGANPGDSATFVRDKDGNLMMMFHSDKMDRADQQTNSTMAAESRQQRHYIDDFAGRGVINEEQQAAAQTIMDETEGELEKIKNEDRTPTVIERIRSLEGEKKEVALRGVEMLAQNRSPNPMESEGAKKAGVKTAEDYLNWLLEKDNITQEEAKTVNRVFNLIQGKEKGLALEHDLDPEEMESINATSINAEKTASQIKILDDRRRRLDEIETEIESPNGERRGLGQVTAAQQTIDQYHLYAINDPSSLAYQSGMCASVIGTDVVNAETLRDCLEVDNTDELLGRLITEAPRPAEEDFEDEGIGVPNSMLQRSNDSFERDDKGSVYYFTTDEEGNVNGKTTDPEDPNIQSSGKEKKPVRVGVATGLKMSSTFMNKEGDRFMVAQKSGRAKGGVGSNLETAGVYGKQLQDCIGAKGKASLHKESVEHKLANILSETQENTLAFHWKKAEDDYPLHYFLRDLNEGSLN